MLCSVSCLSCMCCLMRCNIACGRGRGEGERGLRSRLQALHSHSSNCSTSAALFVSVACPCITTSTTASIVAKAASTARHAWCEQASTSIAHRIHSSHTQQLSTLLCLHCAPCQTACPCMSALLDHRLTSIHPYPQHTSHSPDTLVHLQHSSLHTDALLAHVLADPCWLHLSAIHSGNPLLPPHNVQQAASTARIWPRRNLEHRNPAGPL